MSTVFKIVASSLLALFALFFGVGLVLPREWHVSQSLTIDAPPSAIHEYVANFEHWPAWATRADVDPTLTYSYPGKARGQGAVQVWDGQHSGHGSVTIVESDPERGVWFEQRIESESVNARGSVTYQAEHGVTTVTWTDQGTLPPPLGGFFVADRQRALRAHFERGLIKLKRRVEAEQPALKPKPD